MGSKSKVTANVRGMSAKADIIQVIQAIPGFEGDMALHDSSEIAEL